MVVVSAWASLHRVPADPTTPQRSLVNLTSRASAHAPPKPKLATQQSQAGTTSGFRSVSCCTRIRRIFSEPRSKATLPFFRVMEVLTIPCCSALMTRSEFVHAACSSTTSDRMSNEQEGARRRPHRHARRLRPAQEARVAAQDGHQARLEGYQGGYRRAAARVFRPFRSGDGVLLPRCTRCMG